MASHPSAIQAVRKPEAVPLAIVVIALCLLGVGLLSPRLFSTTDRGSVIARVSVDIKALEAGLMDFKAKFGEYPPSRITLHRDHAGWNSDPRSKAIIRKLWPRFDFQNPEYPHGFFADDEAQKTLNGSECLVFFLGGPTDESGGFVGFSKDPRQPFSPASSLRVGPFFEFSRRQLTDLNGNGLSEYLDPLLHQTKPYVYYTSYHGRGYDAKDRTAGLAHYTKPDGNAWKPRTIQIISPGRDGEYGTGGVYDPKRRSGT